MDTQSISNPTVIDWHGLTDDILIAVLHSLAWADVLVARLVCKQWRRAAGTLVTGVKIGFPGFCAASSVFRTSFPNIHKVLFEFTANWNSPQHHLAQQFVAEHGVHLRRLETLCIGSAEELSVDTLAAVLAISDQLTALDLSSAAMLYKVSGSPSLNQLEAAFASLSNLRSMNLNGYSTPPNILQCLSNLTSLNITQLYMSPRVSIPIIKDKPELRTLTFHIESTGVDDNTPKIQPSTLALDSLPSLTHLHIATYDTLQLTPAVIHALSNLTNLHSLHLDCISDSLSSTQQLSSIGCLTQLQSLSLPTCSFDAQHWHMLSQLPQLSKLQLDTLDLSEGPLPALLQLRELQVDELLLPDMQQEQTGLLTQAVPALQSLSVDYYCRGYILYNLWGHTSITSLNLHFISDEAFTDLAPIPTLKHLQQLQLDELQVPHVLNFLEPLAASSSLRELDLSHLVLGQGQLKALAQGPVPLERLSLAGPLDMHELCELIVSKTSLSKVELMCAVKDESQAMIGVKDVLGGALSVNCIAGWRCTDEREGQLVIEVKRLDGSVVELVVNG